MAARRWAIVAAGGGWGVLFRGGGRGGPRWAPGAPPGSPAGGFRPRVPAVRGRLPSPLDDGGSWGGDCSGGYAVPVHRRVVGGSPVRSRRGPATVNGR